MLLNYFKYQSSPRIRWFRPWLFPVDCGVAWGNGTGATINDYYGFLDTFKSYKVTVAAATTPQAGDGQEIINAALELKARGFTKIVGMGHSQGAAGAINAAILRPDLFNKIVCLMPGNRHQFPTLPNVPCFMVTAEFDTASVPSIVQSEIVAKYNGPIIHGTIKNKTHFGEPYDGAILKYAIRYTLDNSLFNEIYTDTEWIIN